MAKVEFESGDRNYSNCGSIKVYGKSIVFFIEEGFPEKEKMWYLFTEFQRMLLEDEELKKMMTT